MLRKVAGKLGLAHHFLAPDRGSPAVLMYHGVLADEGGRPAVGDHKHTGESLFREHLRLLARRRRVVPLSTLVQTLLRKGDSRGMVAITFDDGYLNNAECAARVLREYSMSAAFFLATGFIGADRWAWTDRLEYVVESAPEQQATVRFDGEPGGSARVRITSAAERSALMNRVKAELKNLDWRLAEERVAELAATLGVHQAVPTGKYRFMSWDQARGLVKDGFEVGAHTVNHAILARVPLDSAEQEILGSQAHIRAETGTCCPTFCYPNGKAADFSPGVMDICRAHFDAALSAIRGAARVEDRYEIRRIGVGHETSTGWLAAGLLREQ